MRGTHPLLSVSTVSEAILLAASIILNQESMVLLGLRLLHSPTVSGNRRLPRQARRPLHRLGTLALRRGSARVGPRGIGAGLSPQVSRRKVSAGARTLRALSPRQLFRSPRPSREARAWLPPFSGRPLCSRRGLRHHSRPWLQVGGGAAGLHSRQAARSGLRLAPGPRPEPSRAARQSAARSPCSEEGRPGLARLPGVFRPAPPELENQACAMFRTMATPPHFR
ncbi:hypothetical protein NDU88_002306 [Pleurodeles waltl]|uniref:Uncharacterized protein n=1 Tax=Pleurodeles waltl TaxID=8319 RepID=A0AAV7P7X2_PLEWA|nr:hypothetical protein NDU88_002306 [Pleurodeles waltl]